jgi:hypothetical protein
MGVGLTEFSIGCKQASTIVLESYKATKQVGKKLSERQV